MGPSGQACNVCWKQKRSCTNGGAYLKYGVEAVLIYIPIGRRRTRDAVVKEEPQSPSNSSANKRKIYSTTDANFIGHIDNVELDFDPAPTTAKRQKTGSNQPAPKATRKSTRSTKGQTRREVADLFERLAREFRLIAKTIDDIAALD
jgi:hypothetical protein